MARMGWVRVARLVALFSVSFLSAVALAISAYALVKDEHDAFDRVNLAAAILSVVALPAMILADICRHCGVLAYLLSEILSLGSLCVLWLTALIVTPSRHPTCSAEPSMPCHHHTYALRILASLSFVILFIYTLTILIKAILVRRSPASHRPAKFWTGTVRDVLDPAGAHVYLSSASSSPLGKDTFMIEGVFDPFRRSSPSARPITVVIDREMLPVDEIIRSPPPACIV